MEYEFSELQKKQVSQFPAQRRSKSIDSRIGFVFMISQLLKSMNYAKFSVAEQFIMSKDLTY